MDDVSLPSLLNTQRAEYEVAIAALQEEIERLKAERDAAFAMSKCECGADEACRNLVASEARAIDAEQRLAEAWLLMEPFAAIADAEDETGRDNGDDDRVSVVQANGCLLMELSIDDFRAARAFLERSKTDENGL